MSEDTDLERNTSQQESSDAVEEQQQSVEPQEEVEVIQVADETDRVSEDLEVLDKEDLIARVVAVEAQVVALKDGYVRAKADVENIQRRSQNEIISARKYAIEGFAQALLEVLDSLDQASKVQLDEGDEIVEKMKEGLELTTKQMQTALEKFGVVAMDVEKGVKFDPAIHQAVSMIDSDEVAEGCVLGVMQKGFMLKDRLLRPAMVVIAKA